MITYQDYLKIEDTDKARANFVRKVINEHKSSDLYKTALMADDYDRCRNTTIMNYQKLITLVTGQQVPDRWSATHRSTNNFFHILVTQLNQYLLGNGVTWENEEEEKLGNDFDHQLQKIGHAALCGGVAYGFYNLNHIVAFTVLEFADIKDEENGKLAAGVRFWQVADDKPLRATHYEADGYTDYMWTKNEPGEDWQKIEDDAYFRPKKPYTWVSVGDAKDREEGTEEIIPGTPVDGLPIIPMYANPHKQSELVGMQEKIDAYDFILNGFEDDLDNAQIYWIIKGAGGMDDPDLQQFLERLRIVGGAAPSDGQEVTPVPVEIPVTARETLLERLNRQLYRDGMIMNPEDIAGGATTATQIRAAYERQNVKADQYEYCVLEFLYELMRIAVIDDNPSFTRSVIVNTSEELQNVISAAQFLEEEYVVTKILTLLGDGDKAEEVLQKRAANEMEQINTEDE
jgi:hypothetical protein